MTKIFSGILALIMLIALFSGCNKMDAEAEKLYSAIEKTAALESYDINYDIDMTMISGGASMDTPAKGSTKKAIVNGDSVTEHKLEVDFGISTSETEIYIVGDTAYMDTSGSKTKLPAEYAVASVPVFDLSQFKKENMVKAEAAEGETDSYTAEFKDGTLDALFDMLLGADEGTTSYKNVTVSFTLNEDGYVSVCKLGFEASASDETLGDYGTVASCTFTYNSPGTVVSLTLPDLSDYEDIADGE